MLNKVATVYSVALETETSVSMQASDADIVRYDFLAFLVFILLSTEMFYGGNMLEFFCTVFLWFCGISWTRRAF